MTAPRMIVSDPPSTAERVKILANPRATAWFYVCCCGRIGQPQTRAATAFAVWEVHRAVCVLRPVGEV